MPARVPLFLFSTIALAGAALASAPTRAQGPGQTVFRGGTRLVPVDVRVLDRDNKPVTDLEAGDFTIYEDGVKQTLQHFSKHTVTPEPSQVDAPLRRTSPDNAVTPPNRRVFLIALGRGRLKDVSRGLDALDAFVQWRTFPQDQIAVMAWNRATEFTTDRTKIQAVLGRFRERHEAMETDMQLYFSGLAGLYARAVPQPIQEHIDYVFYGAEGAGGRAVRPAVDLYRPEDEMRRTADRQLTASIAAFNRNDSTLTALASAETLGANFDDYVALSRQSMQDFGNLLAGIEYLRFVEGEKHMVYVTEHGYLMPSADYDRDIGALAADARVAIDTIQTGGVDASGEGSQFGVAAPAGMALSGLRTIAETSGGQHSVSNYADRAFTRILAATEFGYVLGYTPSRPETEGGFRPIRIEVTRRGVTVTHRRGYFARPAPENLDPRRIMAIARLNAAANYTGDIRDLKLTLKTADVRTGTQRFVSIETTIAADRIVFELVNGRHVAALSQVILCTDEEGRSEGGITRTFDITVPASLLDQVRQTGLKTTVQVPVTKPPVFVRVYLYDYGSDLLGSTFTRMR